MRPAQYARCAAARLVLNGAAPSCAGGASPSATPHAPAGGDMRPVVLQRERRFAAGPLRTQSGNRLERLEAGRVFALPVPDSRTDEFWAEDEHGGFDACAQLLGLAFTKDAADLGADLPRDVELGPAWGQQQRHSKLGWRSCTPMTPCAVHLSAFGGVSACAEQGAPGGCGADAPADDQVRAPEEGERLMRLWSWWCAQGGMSGYRDGRMDPVHTINEVRSDLESESA
ncbi:hypothetical protein B0H11DRAFT_2219561 [Mycena galericulata]|nr:hypothetical protein B0H11DRAFT_2219561 [Mycena galericulata]